MLRAPLRVQRKETARFSLRQRVRLDLDRAVGQDWKMEDVALDHVGDDDLVFQDFGFEVSFGHHQSSRKAAGVRVRKPPT